MTTALPPEMAELREALGDDMRRGERWPIGPSARATIIALLDGYEARGKEVERLEAENRYYRRYYPDDLVAALRKSEERAELLAASIEVLLIEKEHWLKEWE